MASRDCASNKIAGALIAVVVFAAAVTLLRVYVAGDHGAQGKTAAQVSLNDWRRRSGGGQAYRGRGGADGL